MKLFRHFRLLVAGLVFCLGALSTNAFALMGGAVQNGGVALGNVSGANGVVVSTLAGSAGVLGTTDGTGVVVRLYVVKWRYVALESRLRVGAEMKNAYKV